MQNELYIVADAIKALRESRGLTQAGAACRESRYFRITSGED